MELIRRFIMTAILMLVTLTAQAGKDPIGWSISGSLPAVASLNHSYAISFVITSNLPFTMPTALQIQTNSMPAAEVTMLDHCSGLKLAPGQSCQVGLLLIPATSGTKQLSVFMEYGKNKVQIPVKPLTTNVSGGATSLLQGQVLAGFPKAILSNTTYPISFSFTNNSTAALSNLVLSQSPGTSAGYTQITAVNCTALNPGGVCNITGSFTTSATSGAVTVGYTLASSAISGNVDTAAIVDNTTGQGVRTITFINNCATDIYWGSVSSNVNGLPCRTSADCSYPSVCNPGANAGAGECFYPAPVPSSGNYLVPHGGTPKTALITDYGFQFVWSGNFFGRTGCTGAGCQTADCGSGEGACPTGVGAYQPATLAEITMLRSSIDSYDISIVNGFNTPIQMTPTTNNPPFANAFNPPEYNCGSPGNPAAVGALGACTWSFDPAAAPTPAPAYRYRFVTNTSNPGCDDSTVCPGSTVCGLYLNPTRTALTSYCGTVLGYLTADGVCSIGAGAGNIILPNSGNNIADPYFACDSASGVTSVGNAYGTTGNYPAGTQYTNFALFGCKAQPNMDLNTCFNTSANPPASTTNGCGCVNWTSYGHGVVVPPDTDTCVSFNPTWGSNVLPGITFVKKACPTAYAWPYDDKASSFACDDIKAGHPVNTVNYTITFCPA